ncbi:hypothetical protein DYBT9623_01757 [Dyadobacter sp. CECT 9623]|uniref:Thioredoxin domain-containing protein n=1 Tax=Dyadobacter linearis TaxID=2823330 RepID=A0ABM8UNC6_9BACT|nr:TlpA disulfide reductase family protein [Dyadobacter sp. CECT 9623]CAG5069023.1 hypothetical protein DYBT9623_01757 [Dyadobacter sp. CECT 9623]
MKHWYIIFYILSVQSLFAQSGRFTVIGRISNPDTCRTARVMIYDGRVFNVPLKDGVFKLSESLAHPVLAVVSTSQSHAGLGMWLTADTIRAEFERRKYEDIDKRLIQPTAVSGNRESEDYLMAVNTMNGYSKLGLSESMINQKKADFVRGYVSTHTSSYLSLTLLQLHNDYLGIGSSKTLFNALSAELKSSDEGKSLKKALERNEANAIGKKINKISISNTGGKATIIPSQTKQYSLINFWASWCGPCRLEHKDLVKVYKNIDLNKVDFFSVSIDTDKAAWLAAIKKDGLLWTQLSDLKGSKGPAARHFSISSVPYLLLVDKAGVIKAVDFEAAKKFIAADEVEQK